MPRHPFMFAEPLRRCVAAGSALLVLALAIFAASPSAHAWLHVRASDACPHDTPHAPAPEPADACAVVLFASGVSLPLGPITFAPPEPAMRPLAQIAARPLFLIAPRFLRLPERGPPVGCVR